MRQVIIAVGLCAAISVLAVAAVSSQTPPKSTQLDLQEDRAPPGAPGPVFVPSFAFPTTKPAGFLPVASPVTAGDQYLQEMLTYALEGQDPQTWRVQDNPKRPWYHMPWMGPDNDGREYHYGMTSERSAAPGTLGSSQTACRQTWAVGFYNPLGGWTIGRIWNPVKTGGQPDLTALPFEPGTVVAKAIYTQATPQDDPGLDGAPTLTAHIIQDTTPNDTKCPGTGTPSHLARADAPMRLVQLDIAIRDTRAKIGWVFATFAYDKAMPGADPWKKIKPVGLTWGNDLDLVDGAAGAPVDSRVINKFGFTRDFGRHGRMNGLIDNPLSSCGSCHMTAQWPNPNGAMTAGATTPWKQASCWFRNDSPITPFGAPDATGCVAGPAGQTSLDYSLQLSVGRTKWQRQVKSEHASPIPLVSAVTNLFHPNSAEVVTVDGKPSFKPHR